MATSSSRIALFQLTVAIGFYLFSILGAAIQGWIQLSHWTDLLPTSLILSLWDATKGPPKYLQPGGIYSGYGPFPFIMGILISFLFAGVGLYTLFTLTRHGWSKKARQRERLRPQPRQRQDIPALGQLLRSPDAEARRDSARALLAILRSRSTSDQERASIVRSFNGIEDPDIRSCFFQHVTDRIARGDGSSHWYDREVYWIILVSGGLSELIALHKTVADHPTVRWTSFHSAMTSPLLEYAVARRLDTDILLQIMSYGMCPYESGLHDLLDVIKAGSELTLPKEAADEIKSRFARLPSHILGRGTNICGLEGTAMGHHLLKKIRVAGEAEHAAS